MQANAIVNAVERAGGAAELAHKLGLTPAAVYQWLSGSRPIPAARCPEIEAATGVRCEELRPDVNWSVLRAPKAEPANA